LIQARVTKEAWPSKEGKRGGGKARFEKKVRFEEKEARTIGFFYVAKGGGRRKKAESCRPTGYPTLLRNASKEGPGELWGRNIRKER